MAIMFLPTNYKFINVINATREVVAGVKYNLVVGAINSNETEVTCTQTILEKPWIKTEFGQKLRILQYTNCTENGEEYVPQPVDESLYKINPVFQNNDKPMTEERLKDLNKQIREANIEHSTMETLTKITIQPVNAEKTQEGDISTTITDVTDLKTDSEASKLNSSLHQQIQQAVEHIFNTNEDVKRALEEIRSTSNVKDVQAKYETVFEQLVQVVIRSILNNTESINDAFAYEFPVTLSNTSPNSHISGAIVYVEKELEPNNDTESQTIINEVPKNERSKRAIGSQISKTLNSKNITPLKEQLVHRVQDQICNTCQNPTDNHINYDCVKLCKEVINSFRIQKFLVYISFSIHIVFSCNSHLFF